MMPLTVLPTAPGPAAGAGALLHLLLLRRPVILHPLKVVPVRAQLEHKVQAVAQQQDHGLKA